jgi:putative membrane protein
MPKTYSMPVLAATVVVAAALAGCDRRDDVPRPKTDSPATTAPKAPGTGASSVDRSTTERAPATAAAGVQAGDRTFVEKAASAGMAEVAITKHTMDNAASAEVKKIAEHLHTDHTKANQELTKIASSKGITLPAAPEGDKKAEVDQLSRLTGADLDRVVLEKLEKSHRESIKLFEQGAAAGSDPELKAFAEKTLPTLREHLKMVETGRGGDGGASSAK